MRGPVAALAIVLLMTASFHPAFGQGTQEVAITPGRAIGPLTLGMPLERAREIMGGWGTIEEYDGALGHGVCNPERGVGACAFDRWGRLGLSTPGQVVFVLTDDARFTTVPGDHKVGGTLLEMLRTFGLYSSGQETELRWDGRGLAVDVRSSQAGLIVGFIGVYTPRTTAQSSR